MKVDNHWVRTVQEAKNEKKTTNSRCFAVICRKNGNSFKTVNNLHALGGTDCFE